MNDKDADLGTMTMREIDLFENRLQLKTLQEGLKHKAASVDVTPNLVQDAVNGGLGDYAAKFAVTSDDPNDSLDRHSSQSHSSLRQSSLEQGQKEGEDEEPLPVIYPPSKPQAQPPQDKGGARQLVLEIQHGSQLQGLCAYWQTGIAGMLCHPYCVTTYNRQIVRGKTVPNSRNPIFNELLHLYAPIEGPLGCVSISVYSQEPSDSKNADVLIGTVTFDAEEALRKTGTTSAVKGDEQVQHRWLELEGGVSGSLHVCLRLVRMSS